MQRKVQAQPDALEKKKTEEKKQRTSCRYLVIIKIFSYLGAAGWLSR